MKLRTMLLGAAAALAITASAGADPAKDITVTFNPAEQAALVQIFNVALAAQGVAVSQNVTALYQKLLAAAAPPKADDAKPVDDAKPDDGAPPK